MAVLRELNNLIAHCEDMPSVFTRVLYAARANAHHPAHASVCSTVVAGLERYHRRVFRAWLRMPLERKCEDTIPYLRTLSGVEGRVTFEEADELFHSMIPKGASAAETSLFLDNVRGIFQIFLKSAAPHT